MVGDANVTTPFRIPTLADMTPMHEPSRAETLAAALRYCPDLDDFDAVVRHLHILRISIASIGDILDAAIDEARANRPTDWFVSLGDAAADVVNKITQL